MQTITVEEVEQLAERLDLAVAEERGRLMRLIRAEARIASHRAPDKFTPGSREYRDEDGRWDESYPPKQKSRDFSGPKTFGVRDFDYERIATTGGFYYDWRAATTNAGLFVGRDGRVWGCEVEGTGHFGAFAAHPGNCNVELSLKWRELDADEISVHDLREVERALRALAFPASAQQTPAPGAPSAV